MTPEYQVAALWIGGRLSYLEQLCLISFVHAGQHIRLYTYEDIPNVPPGVEVADASEIMPRSTTVVHKVSGSPAPQADAFRYQMLAQLDRTIWADTDAYCVKPFTTANGHFHGWETEKTINNGVLGLPQDSETLRLLIELTSDPYRIPPYLTRVQTSELEAAAARGEPMHAGEIALGRLGAEGVDPLSACDRRCAPFAAAGRTLSVAFPRPAAAAAPELGQLRIITDETFSIHFYGRRMRRRLVTHENGIPRPRSMFGQLLKRHGIDPRLAPIPLKPGDPGFGSDDDDDED